MLLTCSLPLMVYSFPFLWFSALWVTIDFQHFIKLWSWRSDQLSERPCLLHVRWYRESTHMHVYLLVYKWWYFVKWRFTCTKQQVIFLYNFLLNSQMVLRVYSHYSYFYMCLYMYMYIHVHMYIYTAHVHVCSIIRLILVTPLCGSQNIPFVWEEEIYFPQTINLWAR